MSDDSKKRPSPPRTHTVTRSFPIGIEARAFDDFVKRQQTTTPDEPPVDWSSQRDEWLRYLDQLYAQIDSYLDAYLSSGQVRREYRQIMLNEENIGSYTANQMVLTFGRQEVTLTPIGTLLFGMKGRVDALGPAGGARLFLVNTKATSARSIVTVRVGRILPPPDFSQPTEPIEWVWKIGSPPPEINFIELTQETFFEMILAVANA
jgi:hypothetical protein